MNKYLSFFKCLIATCLICPTANSQEVAPIQIELHLSGSGLSHLNAISDDMTCVGGDWQFDWSGSASVETCDLAKSSDFLKSCDDKKLVDSAALLAGEAIYHTNKNDKAANAKPALTGTGIKCQQVSSDGQPPVDIVEGRLAAGKNPQMDVHVSFDEKNQYITVSADDVASCAVKMAFGQELETPMNVMIGSSSSRPQFAPKFSIERSEIKAGFDKTWQFNAINYLPEASMCVGQAMEGSLRLIYEAAN